jgi:hypothetical protein
VADAPVLSAAAAAARGVAAAHAAHSAWEGLWAQASDHVRAGAAIRAAVPQDTALSFATKCADAETPLARKAPAPPLASERLTSTPATAHFAGETGLAPISAPVAARQSGHAPLRSHTPICYSMRHSPFAQQSAAAESGGAQQGAAAPVAAAAEAYSDGDAASVSMHIGDISAAPIGQPFAHGAAGPAAVVLSASAAGTEDDDDSVEEGGNNIQTATIPTACTTAGENLRTHMTLSPLPAPTVSVFAQRHSVTHTSAVNDSSHSPSFAAMSLPMAGEMSQLFTPMRPRTLQMPTPSPALAAFAAAPLIHAAMPLSSRHTPTGATTAARIVAKTGPSTAARPRRRGDHRFFIAPPSVAVGMTPHVASAAAAQLRERLATGQGSQVQAVAL